MNSAIEAESNGARVNLKRADRVEATAGADALTEVTFVVVLLADGAGFLTDFLVDAAVFLVAMDISLLYIEIWVQYSMLPLGKWYNEINGIIHESTE